MSPRHERSRRPAFVSTARARLLARASAGFTIIEVLVATLILTIGIVALITSFTSSQKIGSSAEAHQTAVALAESELERLHGLEWKYLGLSTAEVPTRATGTELTENNPTYFQVSPTTTTCTGKATLETNCYQWNWSESSATEPLVTPITAASGEETNYPNPRSVIVPVTSVHGAATSLAFQIYRYITWVNYSEGSKCTGTECSGTDPKRIVVAVTGSNLNRPVSLVTIVSNRETEKTPFKGLTEPKCEEESGTKPACLPSN